MTFEHRPTFSVEVPLPLAQVQDRLHAGLVGPAYEVRWARSLHGQSPTGGASRRADHLVLTFKPEHRHFWSPWLNLDVDQREATDGAVITRITGRFSPHPTVWTGFAFSYLGLGVLAFFSSIFAYSQRSLGGTPTGLWGLLACAVLAVVLLWSSWVGQRLARDQMIELRRLLEAGVRGPAP
ncbi:MAG: hypothetical protein IV100_21595 [Myxococcales bacterium]|nr:hypothetical protein [Myxococcales bacterium]